MNLYYFLISFVRMHVRQNGQSLIIVTLMLPVLLGMVALAVDGGYAFAQRRQMQNAADAAAVAGARALALSQSVESAVGKYTSENGATSRSWQQVNETRTGTNGQSYTATNIQVTANATFDTFFARVLGMNQMTASATARARVSPLSGASTLLPMTIREQSFVYGTTYQLWDDNHEAPGAFGWVNWPYSHYYSPMPNNAPMPSPSEPTLQYNIETPGASGMRYVGEWIGAIPGVKFTPSVYNALMEYRNEHITIPIYDTITGNGSNTQYRIKAFAEFVLTAANRHANPKWVQGYFVRWTEPGQAGNFSCSYCAMTVKLSQ